MQGEKNKREKQSETWHRAKSSLLLLFLLILWILLVSTVLCPTYSHEAAWLEVPHACVMTAESVILHNMASGVSVCVRAADEYCTSLGFTVIPHDCGGCRRKSMGETEITCVWIQYLLLSTHLMAKCVLKLEHCIHVEQKALKNIIASAALCTHLGKLFT